MSWSVPRASCFFWRIIAARSLSWPMRAIRSRILAQLPAANWFPVWRRSWEVQARHVYRLDPLRPGRQLVEVAPSQRSAPGAGKDERTRLGFDQHLHMAPKVAWCSKIRADRPAPVSLRIRLPLKHEPHNPSPRPAAMPPAVSHQLHQLKPEAGLPGLPSQVHHGDFIGPVVLDLDPDPSIVPVHGHDDLPALPRRGVRDRVRDQLAGQQDSTICNRAPVQDIPHEQAHPPYLASGAGED